MSLLYYVAIAISPVLLIVILVFLKTKSELASFSNIRNSILFGLAGVLLLYVLSYFIELRWHGSMHNMRRMAFFVFVIIAFGSELGMFIPIRFIGYESMTVKGPVEAIIYSIISGLSFSTFTTALIAYGIIEVPIEDNFTLFLLLYPFANIVFAIVLGFFIGMGKIRKNALIDHSTGLFLATFLHGIFYFSFITKDIRLFIITMVGLLIISVTLMYRAAQLFNNRES
jgi:RsiW-degrading membrane proteinase PrsW (M82 family)